MSEGQKDWSLRPGRHDLLRACTEAAIGLRPVITLSVSSRYPVQESRDTFPCFFFFFPISSHSGTEVIELLSLNRSDDGFLELTSARVLIGEGSGAHSSALD